MFEPADTIEDLASAIDRRFFAPLRRILDLSAKGLVRRGFGEEPFLAPLRRTVTNASTTQRITD